MALQAGLECPIRQPLLLLMGICTVTLTQTRRKDLGTMPRPQCQGLQGMGEMRLSTLIATVPSWTTKQDEDSKAVQKKTRNNKDEGKRLQGGSGPTSHQGPHWCQSQALVSLERWKGWMGGQVEVNKEMVGMGREEIRVALCEDDLESSQGGRERDKHSSGEETARLFPLPITSHSTAETGRKSDISFYYQVIEKILGLASLTCEVEEDDYIPRGQLYLHGDPQWNVDARNTLRAPLYYLQQLGREGEMRQTSSASSSHLNKKPVTQLDRDTSKISRGLAPTCFLQNLGSPGSEGPCGLLAVAVGV
ncbi:hypothetical protein Q8A73_010570 [Channa argus]|nr:hypothetical protein Q8A73_010570 [Channa argus]